MKWVVECAHCSSKCSKSNETNSKPKKKGHSNSSCSSMRSKKTCNKSMLLSSCATPQTKNNYWLIYAILCFWSLWKRQANWKCSRVSLSRKFKVRWSIWHNNRTCCWSTRTRWNKLCWLMKKFSNSKLANFESSETLSRPHACKQRSDTVSRWKECRRTCNRCRCTWATTKLKQTRFRSVPSRSSNSWLNSRTKWSTALMSVSPLLLWRIHWRKVS